MTRKSDERSQAVDGAGADAALGAYETISGDWIARSERIDIAILYQPVIDMIPPPPATVLDVGAGTGRDAAWFAAAGYSVTAVEPAERLRKAGQDLHAATAIDWVAAHLPELAGLGDGKCFALQVLIGVWQHLPESRRAAAMRRLHELAADNGRVIMSLRHGPGAPGRPVFAIDADATADLATAAGFSVLRKVLMPSIQTWNQENGVVWTWLVLERPTG